MCSLAPFCVPKGMKSELSESSGSIAHDCIRVCFPARAAGASSGLVTCTHRHWRRQCSIPSALGSHGTCLTTRTCEEERGKAEEASGTLAVSEQPFTSAAALLLTVAGVQSPHCK